MKPEEKCVSLSTAKKLKEAGFPKGDFNNPATERIWIDWADESTNGMKNPYWCLVGSASISDDCEWFSAPDAQELLEAIHKHCNEVAVGWNDSGCYWMVNIGGKGAGSFVSGCGANYGDPDSDSLSESLAKAWIEYEANRNRK